MKPTMDDVSVVLARFDESDWDELRIDADDFHLHVFKSPRTDRVERSASPTPAPTSAAPAPSTAPPPVRPEAEVAPAPGEPTATPEGPAAEGTVVPAPSLGTFYRAPKPGAPPFVEVGAEVTTDTQLCLLEVMKLYTAVEAGVDGVIAQILVDDGALVEHGQPLFVIAPREG